MARTRLLATLLAVAVLSSTAVAAAAGPPQGRLTPTPPVPLPVHQHSRHHEQQPTSGHSASGLPNTGIDARVEVAVALVMVGCGVIAKALSNTRPATRPRRR
jgi:hypothetical protein